MITFPFIKFFSKDLGVVKRPFAKVRLITPESEGNINDNERNKK